ncbi:4-hydroxyphenylacetate 3-hydroxylase family protein [Streptomyces tubercidicus]|uniref:4-hydroxyphenylacetate 3-hydroxylase family protein n=1 Tax=Streptomyces tubercidicus TaxID=47759 RepID=UPI002E0E4364|nr:4-hydroxyphenylacetate 3-monooxygenase [Streptomyces tubercidicus]WSX23737.1 4-hydroxyphenylacetate 3-monooxygenase [Streptomyces tubercidicus]
MSRTGESYLESLDDGREVWIDGARVDNVASHAAFRNSARTIGRLYDMQHAPSHRDILTYEVAETGERAHRAFQIPRSHDDLVGRRKAIKLWSEATFGYMGRTPDYKASMWAGFAAAPGVFGIHDGRDYGANVLAQYRHLRDGDLFQSHAIVNPMIDKRKPGNEQADPFIMLGVVEERDDGIVVRGTKTVATGAVLGHEIQVGTIEPLGREDDDYALAFTVPLNTPGVKIIARRSYERDATSVYDYPFSTCFDENDATIIFEDVLVPWEKVFVYRDVRRSYLQWWDTPGFVFMCAQGATRLWTKLEFLTGLALKIAKMNGSYALPPVRMALGKLLAEVHGFRSLVLAAEANFEVYDETGVVQPNRAITFAGRALGPSLYVSFVSQIRELCGGALIQLPASYRDMVDETEGELIRRYVRSPGGSSDQRVQLFKLAWDVLGSEFGSRHEHYERFYLGAPYAFLPTLLSEGHPEVCETLVDAALESYSIEDAMKEAADGEVQLRLPTDERARRVGAVEGPGVVSGTTKKSPVRDRQLPMWG